MFSTTFYDPFLIIFLKKQCGCDNIFAECGKKRSEFVLFFEKKDKLSRNLGRTFEKLLAEHKIGNAAVSVMQNGKVLCRSFYGTIKLNGNVAPDENTLFRLASMTKPVIGVAVMMQAERGFLDLDAPISTYLPAFSEMYVGKEENGEVVPDPRVKTPVTTRNLLTHTSGIGSGSFGEIQLKNMPQSAQTALKDAVSYYATLPLLFEPGTRQEYSPLFGFDILAHLVEVTSGKTIDEFLRQDLFLPLGMLNTTFDPSEEQKSRCAFLHDCKDGIVTDATPVDGAVFGGVPNSRCCGGGGLAGTLADYEKFAQMLLYEGTYNGVTVLKKETVRQMKTAQLSEKIMPGAQKWGLSMRVIAEKGYAYLPVGSFGWSGAYGTHFWVDPANGITAVLMRNSLIDGGAGARTAVKFEKIVYTSV